MFSNDTVLRKIHFFSNDCNLRRIASLEKKCPILRAEVSGAEEFGGRRLGTEPCSGEISQISSVAKLRAVLVSAHKLRAVLVSAHMCTNVKMCALLLVCMFGSALDLLSDGRGAACIQPPCTLARGGSELCDDEKVN